MNGIKTSCGFLAQHAEVVLAFDSILLSDFDRAKQGLIFFLTDPDGLYRLAKNEGMVPVQFQLASESIPHASAGEKPVIILSAFAAYEVSPDGWLKAVRFLAEELKKKFALPCVQILHSHRYVETV